MSYEPPDYQKLVASIDRLVKIRDWIDRARQFEKMKYRQNMTVTASPGLYDESGTIEASVPPYLKDPLIKCAVAYCLQQAKLIHDKPSEGFLIDDCISV